MKSPYEIIISPLLTEKTKLQEKDNKYTFLVKKDANEIEIKQAIEKIYDVKVKKVNTINIKPKPKRWRFRRGFTSSKKKVIATLKEGYKIEFK